MQPLMELGPGRQGQTGGIEMGKYLSIKRKKRQHLSTSLMQNTPTHQKRDLAACRGVVSYPPLNTMKTKTNQETRTDSQSTRTCSSKKKGELDKPP